MSNMEKSLSPDLKRASGAVDLGATNSLFKRAPKMAISRNEIAALGARTPRPGGGNCSICPFATFEATSSNGKVGW